MLFSLGCGAIMHCYSDSCGEHRDVFKSKYLNVLDFIFGNEGGWVREVNFKGPALRLDGIIFEGLAWQSSLPFCSRHGGMRFHLLGSDDWNS